MKSLLARCGVFALSVVLMTPAILAGQQSKKGVEGTIVRLNKDGDYKVNLGDGVEVQSSSPVGIGGDPANYEIRVDGPVGVVEIERAYLLSERPQLIGANNIGAFLKTKKPGKVKITAGIQGKPAGITLELEVLPKAGG